ncbi:MAG: hypothetical protein ACKO54_20985 [Alphaproteobacteria bacterium]
MAKLTRRSLIAAPLALGPLACPAYAQAPWPTAYRWCAGQGRDARGGL